MSTLIGVKQFNKRNLPDDGEHVIWFWSSAGLLTAGDFYLGECRDAAKNYQTIPQDSLPTHWMEFPENWP